MEEKKVKSRYFTTQSEIKQAVNREMQSHSDAIFVQVAEKILPQVTAVVCYVLRTQFGFGRKRLVRFLTQRNDLYDFISKNEKIAGKIISTKDIQDEMEKYLGLEFRVVEMSIQDTPKSRKRRLK